MMRRSFALICLGLAVSGCSASTSRNAGNGPNMPTMVTPLMLEPPPIYSILGFRDKIQLTSAQITSLDSIATWVHDQNVPLIQELREKASPTRNQVGLVIPDEQKPKLELAFKQAAEAMGPAQEPRRLVGLPRVEAAADPRRRAGQQSHRGGGGGEGAHAPAAAVRLPDLRGAGPGAQRPR